MLDFKKESIFIDTDARGTEKLCKMCGKCCLVIATEYSHEKLLKMAEQNEKEAQVFTEFFQRYNSMEDAKKVVPEQVDKILQIKKECHGVDPDDVDFYYCTYIDDNKMCTIHKDRPLCCRTAPGSGWSNMPPGCGYEGWQFEQREKFKAIIRSLKETLHECLTLYDKDDFIPDMPDTTVCEFEKILQEKIEYFERYGSRKW